MERLERISYGLLLAVIATIPFDLLAFPVMSNLQWAFVILAVTSTPLIWKHRQWLLTNRVVLAAIVFVVTQWSAAVLAEEFRINAIKGAVRVTAGLMLLCAALCLRGRPPIAGVWQIAAVVAAVYALVDYFGYGVPSLFRDQEFTVAGIRRLSGSFEYPNTAAAYFALSLPVLATIKSGWGRTASIFVVGSALLLTYSRGAIIAAGVALLIWAGTARSRPVLIACSLFVVTVLTGLLLRPSLVERLTYGLRIPLDAEYQADFNQMRLRPNSNGEFVIRVKNAGQETWLHDGERPVTIAYRWYDLESRTRVRPKTILSPLSGPVRPQESTTIHARFNTPEQEGRYLLVWDMNRPGNGWFGVNGVIPWVVEVDIQEGTEPWYGHADVSRWYQDMSSEVFLFRPNASRLDLWRVAWELGLEHPFLGVGPDNFRLLYSSRIGFLPADSTIRSNNQYLELFSGSGLFGLAAFLLMLALVPRSTAWPVIAVAIFMVHGLVDVFLMTTPIYFAFWVLIGLATKDKSRVAAV